MKSHFTILDFTCLCCETCYVQGQLLKTLEELRRVVAGPIIVSSGYRCAKHNADIANSSKNSAHIKGLAADLYCPELLATELYKQADKLFRGVGLYHSWVHVDMAERIARW